MLFIKWVSSWQLSDPLTLQHFFAFFVILKAPCIMASTSFYKHPFCFGFILMLTRQKVFHMFLIEKFSLWQLCESLTLQHFFSFFAISKAPYTMGSTSLMIIPTASGLHWCQLNQRHYWSPLHHRSLLLTWWFPHFTMQQ